MHIDEQMLYKNRKMVAMTFDTLDQSRQLLIQSLEEKTKHIEDAKKYDRAQDA